VTASYYHLSHAYKGKSNNEQALSYATKAVTTAKKLYGPKHLKTKKYAKYLKGLTR